MKFINFLNDKMFGFKEEYKNIASDTYSHGILKDNEMTILKIIIFGIKKMIKIKAKKNMITRLKCNHHFYI